MREIFPFTKALRTLGDGKVLMNSHTQPIRHRIKDGKYELNSLGKWVVQSCFYMNADEMKAWWWEAEPEPEWKDVKWWEALEWAANNPGKDFQVRFDPDHPWEICEWGDSCAIWELQPVEMFGFQWRIPREVSDVADV